MTLELKIDWLDDLHIATPCRANWERMEKLDAEGRARFCRTCEKKVYNVSLMSHDEAKALIVAHEGSLCVRLARRQDGTLVTNDCPVGQSRQLARGRFKTALAVLLVALVPSPVSSALLQASGWVLRTVPGPGGVVQMAEQSKPVKDVVAWWERTHAPHQVMGRIAMPPRPPVPLNPPPPSPAPKQ